MFIKVDGNPINNGDLGNMLHRLSEFLNLPHQHFKSHSLRIGGSLHLHLSSMLVNKIKEIRRWSSSVFKKYIRVYLCDFIAVANRIWFIGDSLMIKAYDLLMQHKDQFPQIADFDGFNTSFSEAMLLEHMPAMLLDMISHYQYIPELVLVNVGASDFTRFTSSQQHANIRKMTIMCNALTKQVVRPTDTFHGFFYNLMILLPW